MLYLQEIIALLATIYCFGERIRGFALNTSENGVGFRHGGRVCLDVRFISSPIDFLGQLPFYMNELILNED